MIAAWALLASAAVGLVTTPLAIGVARRTDFYDHPARYKGHLHPTPYALTIVWVVGLVNAFNLRRG